MPSKTRWDWRAPIQREPASVHIKLSIVEEDTRCPLRTTVCTSPPNTHMHVSEWITELESSWWPNLREKPSSCRCTSVVDCFCHYGFCPHCHVDKLRQHCNLSGSVCRWRQLMNKVYTSYWKLAKEGFLKIKFQKFSHAAYWCHLFCRIQPWCWVSGSRSWAPLQRPVAGSKVASVQWQMGEPLAPWRDHKGCDGGDTWTTAPNPRGSGRQ